MGYGRKAIEAEMGIQNLAPGVEGKTVSFSRPMSHSPSVVLTSSTVQGSGASNAWVSEVCSTSFKINTSDAGNSVDVHWRAILDRQQPSQGKGDALELSRPPVYSLNEEFTDNSGNTYSNAAAKKLVLWLEMTSGAPTDKAPETGFHPAFYEGSVSAGNLQPLATDAPERLTVTLDDGDNKNIIVVPHPILSHNTLPTGTNPNVADTDRAFSFSLWVKPNNSASTDDYNYLFSKGHTLISAMGYDKEYYCFIDLQGDDPLIRISLVGGTSTQRYLTVKSAIIPTASIEDKWTHIVITYIGGTVDHVTPDWAATALKIYVNGAYSTPSYNNLSANYESMLPDHSKPLYIGAAWNAHQEFTGDMAEFAMWQDRALTATEVMAIYNSSIGLAYGA